MRLAVDVKSLLLHRSGIASYTRALLALLAAHRDAVGLTLVLIGPRAALDTLDRSWPAEQRALELRGSLGPLRIPYYDQIALGRAVSRAGADALFTPNCDAPARLDCPRVVTIHDLAYARFRRAYPRAMHAYYHGLTRWHARRASAVVTDSAFSARELRSLAGTGSARERAAPVVIVPCPLAPGFLEPVDPDRVRAFVAARGLPNRFVLYTGGADIRKNVRLLVDAMAQLNATSRAPAPLVATSAGMTPPAWRQQLGTNWQEARGMLLSDIALADMPLLYAAASAVGYVSRYEGFGLPVLEALAVGTPVVSTRVGFLLDEEPPGVSMITDESPTLLAARLRAALDGEIVSGHPSLDYARAKQSAALSGFIAALQRGAGWAPPAMINS